MTATSPTDIRRAVRVAADPEALAQAAASVFVTLAMATPKNRDLTVALAGGSTPRRMHEILAAPPHRDAILWKNIQFFWGDERCVPPDHKDSNYNMARETLLEKTPIDPAKVHRMKGEVGPVEGCAAYLKELDHVPAGPDGLPSFDLIYLGMGDDGHTLSLFPGTAPVTDTTNLVAPGYNKNLDSHRITFTPRLLNAARLVVFVVGGASKADVLRQVLEEEGPVETYPSRCARPTSGSVLWLLDAAAASKLSYATLGRS